MDKDTALNRSYMPYRYGEMMVPDVLANKFAEYIGPGVKKVLITEYQGYFGKVLDDILSKYPNIEFTLTTRLSKLDQDSYLQKDNVKLISASIYDEDFTLDKFDLILSVPVFAVRKLSMRGEFISESSDLIAAQNLLYHLTVDGKLAIVLPAKTAFARDSGTVMWRSFVETSFNIDEINALPGGIFPGTTIRTYLFVFSNRTSSENDIVLRRYEIDNSKGKNAPCEKFVEKDSRLCFREEFSTAGRWNIDMAFSMDSADTKKFVDAGVAKRRLGDVASIFRGKAVKGKSEYGNIGVINISDITETGINYSDIYLIQEEEHKVARYVLKEGDVLVTTRGTKIKVAIFEKQSKLCIPSANIIVIRPEKGLLGIYLKLFLNSTVGEKMLSSIQRGSTVTNINYEDVKELTVPVPPIEGQEALANEYSSGLKKFIEAEKTWQKTQINIQSKLFCEDFIVNDKVTGGK